MCTGSSTSRTACLNRTICFSCLCVFLCVVCMIVRECLFVSWRMTDYSITSALLRYFSSSDPGPILRRPGPAAVKYAKTRAYKPLSSYPYECASTIPRGKPCICVCVCGCVHATRATEATDSITWFHKERAHTTQTDRQNASAARQFRDSRIIVVWAIREREKKNFVNAPPIHSHLYGISSP